MTPEEFTARAAVAVEPLQPGPAAYTWLRTSIDRRRRRTRALAATGVTASLALAGVAYATLPGGGTAPPVAGQPGAPSRSAANFDFDGDGQMDDAFVVDQPDRTWGIDVQRSRAGRTTVWMPGDLGRSSHAVAGSTDLDRDGRAEVVVAVGNAGGPTSYVLLAPVGDDMVWVTGKDFGIVRVPENANGTAAAFQCVDLVEGVPGVVLDPEPDDAGQVTVHVLRDGVLRPAAQHPAEGGALPPLRSCYLG